MEGLFEELNKKQLGFNDANECKTLCTLASLYIIKSEGMEEKILEYFSSNEEPKNDSPKIIFMGGGMVVEADAFKEIDVIYQALKSKGHHQDMLSTSELVHQSSTRA
ncbi:calmodulin calcium-dependent NAD kinase-like [Impatiens glandulifera]|uniref:calmodulin calcium-dependent NAD kinase-like n=1 Tax=Impatiens glandulifera TaxID=253017 RepID=UPI001FB19450|nr:calmodulin calcium-dependent NAD kinase-like [Impatiens glandulifera]